MSICNSCEKRLVGTCGKRMNDIAGAKVGCSGYMASRITFVSSRNKGDSESHGSEVFKERKRNRDPHRNSEE